MVRIGKARSRSRSMHDPEKSDPGIVATKPTNKAGRPVAELVEPRLGTKGNASQQSTHRSQSRERVTQALERVRHAARQRKKEQFTALLHHVNVDTLRTSFYALKRKAAPGVGWRDMARLRGRPRTQARGPARSGPPGSLPTATIPPDVYTEGGRKAAAAGDSCPGRQDCPGRNRPGAERIYEGDFCGFSYGFRPGRGQHDALDALAVAINRRKVNWILDADIRDFLDAVS